MEGIWQDINNNINIYMKEIHRRYNLKFIKLTSVRTAMVGDDFAIIIGIGRFDAAIFYVYREKEELVLFNFDTYITMKYDDDDRKDLLKGDGARIHVTNYLTVIQRGLLSKWSNILEGDKEWIKDYKRSNYYYHSELQENDKKILEKYI